MSIITSGYKATQKVCGCFRSIFDRSATWCLLKCNGVRFSSFRTSGVPYVMVARGAKGMSLGANFAMNNGIKGNPIGQYERCTFFVAPKAQIEVGDNVGMSQCSLVAMANINIKNNVKIGGGTVLITSDFHSLNADIRRSAEDTKHKLCAPIVIEEDVFIGMRCIIMKGVTIGARSIVGAGSVVTKSIPADEIWAGNPAKCIRKI